MTTEKQKEILGAAEIYSNAAFQLNVPLQEGENLYKLFPSQMLAGLALELYLKSIYFMEKNIDFKKNGRFSHNLEDIYEELEESSKEIIVSKYYQLIKDRDMTDIRNLEKAMNIPIDTSFPSMLKNWNGIFVYARYFYEGTKDCRLMLLYPEIRDSLISLILHKNPALG